MGPPAGVAFQSNINDMAARKSKGVPQLWAVFDTNAVYTGSASYLLRKEVVDLIQENSRHPDLQVRWIIPEIVRHEREYQMCRQALAFLPTVEKLERLLGHNLNIAADILRLRVSEAIKRQLDELHAEVEELDVSRPNWRQLMLDSAYRRPPFDTGESEKGFRDALIVETFAQLVEKAPQNPKVCRVTLVTGDARLSEAARIKSQGSTNVRLFSTVDELRGLINTLVSQVDEIFVKGLMPQAERLFVGADKDSLYHTAGISATIRERLTCGHWRAASRK